MRNLRHPKSQLVERAPGPATDLPTVLFTNALGIEYAAVAFDKTTSTRLDPALVAPVGAQVCLRLSSARLRFRLLLHSAERPHWR